MGVTLKENEESVQQLLELLEDTRRTDVVELQEMVMERPGIKRDISWLEERSRRLEVSVKEQQRILTDTESEDHILQNPAFVCTCEGVCTCTG